MNGTERSPAGKSPLAELDRQTLELAMRAEASDIRERRSDITRPAGPIPVVIIDIPAGLTCRDLQIAVHHRPWGEVEVDVREKPSHAWTPIGSLGGDFEVRSA